MKPIILAAGLALVAPVARAECAALPDIAEPSARLILELREAENEMAAREFNAGLWELWLTAPDAEAQALLDEGIARLRVADHEGAEAAFSELIAYCPDYAEGYNQRAFVNFLRQDYEAALPDLERALALSPRHVGALTGQALTLIALQRPGEAAVVLRRALDLNPWLGERHLLPGLEALEEDI